MKERPVLFSAPMVRAILDGSKTQTRREVKAKYLPFIENLLGGFLDGKWNQRPLPYGKPGDRLWVRETWLPDPDCDDDSWDSNSCSYVEWSGCGSRIDGVPLAMRKPEHCIYREDWDGHDLVWRPSIHMPRWASRILLEIVSVRVERLNDISAADSYSEGIDQCLGLGSSAEIIDLARRMGTFTDETLRYATLWESINGVGSWEANPWVWVVEFKRVDAQPSKT